MTTSSSASRSKWSNAKPTRLSELSALAPSSSTISPRLGSSCGWRTAASASPASRHARSWSSRNRSRVITSGSIGAPFLAERVGVREAGLFLIESVRLLVLEGGRLLVLTDVGLAVETPAGPRAQVAGARLVVARGRRVFAGGDRLARPSGNVRWQEDASDRHRPAADELETEGGPHELVRLRVGGESCRNPEFPHSA